MQGILFLSTRKCADLVFSLTPYDVATVQETWDHFNITIGTFHVATSLLCLQFNQNHFRTVVDSEWKDAVSDTSTHKHIGIVFCIDACVVFREQALIRCYRAADKGQAELATVCMTTQDQVHTLICVSIEQLRPMG